MALYHAHTSYISRGSTNSVCAHAAYICAEKVKDERTGELFDFTKKRKEVLHKEILLPTEAKGLFATTEDIWNAVERHEDYIAESRYGNYRDPLKQQKSLAAKERFLETAVTGFKLECSLPVEFNAAQKIALSKKIAEELFLSKNLIVEYAIHDIKDNPHVHFLSNFRPIIDGKFSNRKVHFRPKDIKEMRKQIADITNQYAKEEGFDFRIDHRSYKDQGLEKKPTQHRGWYGSILKDRSRIYHDNKEILSDNTKKLLLDPEELLKSIIPHKTVFTLNDLQKGITKQFKNDQQAHYVLDTYLKGRGIERLLERANTFGDFMKVCQDIRSLSLVPNQTKPIQQDIKELTYERVDLAREILADYGQYKWLMSRCGYISKERLLILSNRSNITWNNKADPFDKVNIPKDLDGGSVLLSLESCKKEALGKQEASPILRQEVIDLFNLHYAGKDIRDQPYYVQHQDHQKEQHVSQLIEELSHKEITLSIGQRLFQKVPEKLFKKVIQQEEQQQGYIFSKEQKDAIAYLSTHKRYVSLIGKAGTGKTTVLRAVAGTYKAAGYRVIGTSFQGAAVGELSRSLGHRMDHGYTLDKIYSELQKETPRFQLTPKSVVIVDEAGMAPPRLLIPLLETVKAVGAKVIMVGDPGQIPAIDRADYGRMLLEGGATLTEIRRQKTETHLKASQCFAEGDYISALDIYAREQRIDISHGETGAKIKVAAKFMEDLAALKRSFAKNNDIYAVRVPGGRIKETTAPGTPIDLTKTDLKSQEKNKESRNLYDDHAYQDHLLEQAALAFRKRDISDINVAIQSQMKAMGFLGEKVEVYTRYHHLTQKEWERIVLDGLHDELIDHIRSVDVPWGKCIGSMANLKKPDYSHFKDILDVLKEKDSPYYETLSQKVGIKTFYLGEKVIFKRNWNGTKGITSDRPIYNGTVGIITRCQDNVLQIRVNEGGWGDVDVDLRAYADIDLGYAMTINRSQGKTLDRVYVYLDNTNQAKLQENLLYVAGTRHRKEVSFYTHEQYLQGRSVYDVVDTSNQKLLSRDFNKGLNEDTEKDAHASIMGEMPAEHVNPEKTVLGNMKKSPTPKDLFRLKEQARKLHTSIQRDVRAGKCDLKAHEQYQAHRDILNTRREVAKFLLASFDTHGLRLKAAGVTIKHLRQLAGDLPYTLTKEDEVIGLYKSYCDRAAKLWEKINQTKHKKQHPAYDTFIEMKVRRDEKAYEALSFGLFREYTSQSGKTPHKTPKYQFERRSDYRQLRQHANQHMQRMQRGDIPGYIQREMYQRQENTNTAIYTHNREQSSVPQASPAPLTAGNLVDDINTKDTRQKIKGSRLWGDSMVGDGNMKRPALGEGVHVGKLGGDVCNYNDMERSIDNPQTSLTAISIGDMGQESRKKGIDGKNHGPIPHHSKGHPSRKGLSRDINMFFERVRSSIDVEGFISSTFGKGVSSGEYLRFGNKGHLSIHRETGSWTNFREGTSGSLLGSKTKPGLLSQSELERGVSYGGYRFEEALQYAKNFIRDHDVQQQVTAFLEKKSIPLYATPKDLNQKQQNLAQRREQMNLIIAQKKEKAAYKALTTRSIEGTPVEVYLQRRGIENDTLKDIKDNRESDIRYKAYTHNNTPQHHMIGIIRDPQNNIQGLQTTYLNAAGEKDPTQSVSKRTEGILKGGFVRIQEDHNNTNRVILAEGIETALSLKQSGLQGEIRAVLSLHNFKTQEGLENRDVIIAADNDFQKMNPDLIKALLTAKTTLNATVIQPPKSGQDFNDVLQEKGPKEIQKIFERGNHLDTFKENFMNELQKKCDYLDEGIKTCRFMEKDFGVKGPDGQIHKTADDYLSSIGQDETLKGMVDYESALGEVIKEAVYSSMEEKQMDKGRTL